MKYNEIDLGNFVNVLTDEKVKSNIAKKFKLRRKEAGFTQQELAKVTGVSYGTIKRFEQTGEIQFSSLLILSNKLDCLSDFNHLFENSIVKDIRF